MALEVGALADGRVTGIMEYGAFVDIGGGQTGMVHISEVAVAYVTNIRDHLAVGQAVRVKVLSISPEGKVSLSIKKAGEQPPSSGDPSPAPRRPRHGAPPNVWQGQRSNGPAQGFEDMMNRFKQSSEDKISTLRRSGGDTRYGGAPKRGGRK
jgi:S1 RNA binding domain protein